MHQLTALVVAIGFAAQLVDGAMGMGYGVTSSTLLLLAGFAPAVASASLHLAEVATSVASGLAHRSFGNVDNRVAATLAVPGAVGAFAGAALLGSYPADRVRPVVAAVLFGLGATLLLRFARGRWHPRATARPGLVFLAGLGLVGGLLDAVGGGGWGPVVTTTLLARTALPPRLAVGSVSLSEIAVALAATVGFAVTLGAQAFAWQWVLALVAGGVAAAPVAAWTVRRIPRHVLGPLVGGTILLTNARHLLHWAGAGSGWAWAVYTTIVAATAVVAWLPRLRRRRARLPLAAAGERPAGGDAISEATGLGPR